MGARVAGTQRVPWGTWIVVWVVTCIWNITDLMWSSLSGGSAFDVSDSISLHLLSFGKLWIAWWRAALLWKQGASHAAARLLGLQEFKSAKTIKINPDAPQKTARFLTLEVSGSILFSFPFYAVLLMQGSHKACHAIGELEVFRRTSEVKVDPDKPLEGVRLVTLQVIEPPLREGNGIPSAGADPGPMAFIWHLPHESFTNKCYCHLHKWRNWGTQQVSWRAWNRI